MRFLLAILFAVQALANPTFNALLVQQTFNPADYGTVAAWYAPRKETAYVNSDPMGTLTDWSGNSRNATGAGGARPTYVTGVQNGQPSARFDGVANVLTTASVDWTQSVTVFCVFRIITKTVDYARVVEIGANNHFALVHWTGSAGNCAAQWNTGAVNTTGFNSMSTLSFVGSAGSFQGWRNGTSMGSGSDSVVAANRVLTIGNFGGGGSYYGNFDLMELIIYTGTVSDRAAVEAALQAIYAHY